MNKKYVKPELCHVQISALEKLAAYSSFEDFSAFTGSITTYAFNSAFEEVDV